MRGSDRTCVRPVLETKEELLQRWSVIFLFSSSDTFRYITIPTGRRARDIAIKDEPRSPIQAAPRKRKVYSTTDANAIGHMDPVEIDFDPPKTVGKRRKVVASGSATVHFDGVAIPAMPPQSAKATRKSARVAKTTSRKDVSELFSQLGQQFHAIANTCEEIGEAL